MKSGDAFPYYLLAYPNYVAHIPEDLSLQESAPIIRGGMTSYKGIRQTEARPAEWLVISGPGALGHLAMQYGKHMGLKVCAVDIDDGKLALAKRLGADVAVDSKRGDPAAAVKKPTDGGARGAPVPMRSQL